MYTLHRKTVETEKSRQRLRSNFILYLGKDEISIVVEHVFKTNTTRIIPEGHEKHGEIVKLRKIDTAFPINFFYIIRGWKIEARYDREAKEFGLIIDGINFHNYPYQKSATDDSNENGNTDTIDGYIHLNGHEVLSKQPVSWDREQWISRVCEFLAVTDESQIVFTDLRIGWIECSSQAILEEFFDWTVSKVPDTGLSYLSFESFPSRKLHMDEHTLKQLARKCYDLKEFHVQKMIEMNK